jgi:hypothetical protein
MMKQSRKAQQLERLIMRDFDRMLEGKTRSEAKAAFALMAHHIKQRTPEQVRAMELKKRISWVNTN